MIGPGFHPIDVVGPGFHLVDVVGPGFARTGAVLSSVTGCLVFQSGLLLRFRFDLSRFSHCWFSDSVFDSCSHSPHLPNISHGRAAMVYAYTGDTHQVRC